MTFLETVHKPKAFPRSSAAFKECFNTNEECLKYIASIKWSNGWNCSRCGYDKFSFITTRNLIRCKKCKYEESFIANSLMRRTKNPITDWFWVIYTLATEETGLSAMELRRQLCLGSYRTAWYMLHKIRMAMANSDCDELKGDVEIDKTLIQAGTEKQVLVACAVELKFIDNYKQLTPTRIRLRVIPDPSPDSFCSFILENVEQFTTIETDWCVLNVVFKSYRYFHPNNNKDFSGSSEKEMKFERVHKVFSDLRSWLTTTYRFIPIKHMQSYLDEFVFRYNRKNNPQKAFNDLLKIVLSNPKTLRGDSY